MIKSTFKWPPLLGGASSGRLDNGPERHCAAAPSVRLCERRGTRAAECAKTSALRQIGPPFFIGARGRRRHTRETSLCLDTVALFLMGFCKTTTTTPLSTNTTTAAVANNNNRHGCRRHNAINPVGQPTAPRQCASTSPIKDHYLRRPDR